MQICNGIGTTVDSKYINLEPKHVVMNDSVVVIANNLSFTIWQYNIPCAKSREISSSADDSISNDQK